MPRMKYTCPLTENYVKGLALVPVKQTWLGDMHGTRLQTLRIRASVGGYSKKTLQLRAFLALEIMTTRGLVDVPLASIVKVSKLRWPRSAVGLTKVLSVLRAERAELMVACAEFKLEGVLNMDPRTMTNDRRLQLIQKYELVEEAAVLLRRSLRNTTFWEKLGAVGSLLAEAVEHLGFQVQMNIVDELLAQNDEEGRRAWDPVM